MSKEVREIIAFQEQQAAAQNRGKGNQKRLSFLQTLRSMIDYGEKAGHLDAQLPVEAAIVLPQLPTREQAPVVDLIQQTYEILTQLREPTPEEKATLEVRGQVFLPLKSKTYAQVVAEDPDHFWKDELNYANGKPALRDYALPQAAEVGLNPSELAAPGSFSKSKEVQLEMAQACSLELQKEFSDARVVMLPVTGYAQWDHAYKEKNGDVAFKSYFARGLDQLSVALSAHAGRGGPSGQFGVNGWFARGGGPNIALVPAVVFVKS